MPVPRLAEPAAVRTIAAVPAAALLAGSACGLLVEPPPIVFWLLVATGLAGALFARARERPLAFGTSVALGFFAAAAPLAATDWQRAWRPPLRVTFEDLARREREESSRRLPEDDSAFAVLEGMLRGDAAPTEAGVLLSILVDRVQYSRQSVSPQSVSPQSVSPQSVSPQSVSPQSVSPQSSVRSHQSQWGVATPQRLTTDDWRLTTVSARGGVIVTVVGSLADGHRSEWRAGRRVRVPASLRRPSRYLDPGVPDQERALARRGTTLVGTVKSGALVDVVAPASWLDERLGDLRAFARRAIQDGVGRWSPASASIVAAIVIGDRAGLDDDVERRLQEAGTYHVIAISGGNIAILAGLLLGAFRTAGWLGRTATLAAIALLVLYARLVGGGASVDRATLMAVVYLGARTLDQRTSPLNAISVTCCVVIATDPLSIADPAFLLTFGATVAIVAVVPVLAARPIPAPLRPLLSLLAASIAAEAMLFPVVAMFFSRVTFAGLGLNFLAIPLMALAQVAGMAVVPLAPISSRLAAVAGLAAHAGASGLVWSAQLIRYAPLLTYRIAPPSWWVAALYYTAALSAWVVWRRRMAAGSAADAYLAARVARASSALAAWAAPRQPAFLAVRMLTGCSLAAGLWVLADPSSLVKRLGDGVLHATFLDVGQGDAILVRFPRGTTLLVDAGGLGFSTSFDVGERVVAPVIRNAGFYRLDYVAVTHGDPDHIGGAASIIEEFRPREVWEGIPVPRSAPLAALARQSQVAASRWLNVYRGDRRSIDGVDVLVRHPGPADWERQRVRNDDSIVLELRWRDVSVVLTGDIGRASEAAIAPAMPGAALRVIKVPHHGSLTSSSPEFLAALRPRIAVVSAGRGNHFGHPVPEVLERYRAAGADVFRTDHDGAVTVSTDGRSIDVRTYTGRSLSVR